MIENVTVIGAGNGGKAAAADLTLQKKRVSLFEFPEYRTNIKEIIHTRTLETTGAIKGRAVLEQVTCDLSEALEKADTIMVCTQALGHERAARELAPMIHPDQLIILNPGSTGGSLHFARVFREMGLKGLPTLVETSTLTYACRARGAKVDILVKVARVVYSTLPGRVLERIGPELEGLYPGLTRGASVLEAGLNNGNPVIHPAITLLNAARIEKEGSKMFFYRDGVSPVVARLIQKVDEERMALLKALGYPAQPEPVTSVQQGYASSTDYFECYGKGLGYRDLPSPDSLDNRYLHEDIGMSLVMFCSLGKLLGVPTPTCELIVRLGENLTGMDYFAKGIRTVEALGLAGMQLDQIKSYLETGGMPGVC